MKEYKRIITVVLITIFILAILLSGISKILGGRNVKAEEIANELIRFHVLANSDSEQDQKLKIKVKNDVIKYMYPKLNEVEDIEESRKIIKEEMENIKEIALKRISEEGYEYGVKINLEMENFPEKRYGDVVLPPGEYEAVRILIGEAEGRNWWCVMFPPLCFVDVTMEDFAFDETQIVLKKHLSEDDVEKILKKEKEVKFKFKILELFKKDKKDKKEEKK